MLMLISKIIGMVLLLFLMMMMIVDVVIVYDDYDINKDDIYHCC